MADTIPGGTSSTQVLAIGSSSTSTIDFIGDADWWKVDLVYGYRYQVWLDGYYENKGTLLDPYLEIFNGNGVFSFANDNGYILSNYSYTYVTPTSSGYFFLSAEESGNNATGTYTITIWQDELASTSSAATIAINSISDVGHIGWQGDISDWYGVNLSAGVQYQFDLIGSAGDGGLTGLTLVDPYLVLRNSAGATLVTNDDSGVYQNSRIIYTPTSSGTYFLDAQEFGNNAYGTYRIIVNASPITSNLTLGTLQTGTISFNGDVDLYSLALTSGITYGFSLDGVTLTDPYMEILDGTGNNISSDDDSGVGINSYLTYTPSSTGTYYLAARESGNNATGTYKAKVWQLPTVSIANASITEGNSGSNNLVFAITLSAASPIDISFTVTTSGNSTATNTVDFTPASRTLTITAGQTTTNFTVEVLGDTTFEPTESFRDGLHNPRQSAS